MAHEPSASTARWLVVGHGSVGSFIAERLATTGSTVAVLDPAPRLPIVVGTAVNVVEAGAYDCVISCVPPDMAETVPAIVSVGLDAEGLFFDWNTVSPEVKRRIAAAVPVGTVDVALLDSVDGGNGRRPRLAVSGAAGGRGGELLAGAGFDVVDAGPDVGQAAALKYLRSVFMKTLEALVLEFSALAAELDPDEIVRSSLTNNLGTEFSSFMDLLVSTNRVHATRRANELADAVASFADEGTPPDLAAAAVGVLLQAAEAWEKGAPAEGAAPDELHNISGAAPMDRSTHRGERAAPLLVPTASRQGAAAELAALLERSPVPSRGSARSPTATRSTGRGCSRPSRSSATLTASRSSSTSRRPDRLGRRRLARPCLPNSSLRRPRLRPLL